MLTWAAKHYPGVKIRVRVSTNKNAEARDKTTGELLAAETSMFKLKEVMKTEKFKSQFNNVQSGFGFETAIFEGAGY